jgi:hypothetical protein
MSPYGSSILWVIPGPCDGNRNEPGNSETIRWFERAPGHGLMADIIVWSSGVMPENRLDMGEKSLFFCQKAKLILAEAVPPCKSPDQAER